jgi:translation elongation factor P/translation initiation factor 5A
LDAKTETEKQDTARLGLKTMQLCYDDDGYNVNDDDDYDGYDDDFDDDEMIITFIYNGTDYVNIHNIVALDLY